MKSPNNKGVTWLYLVRLPGEASLGLNVRRISSGPRGTKLYYITHVDPVGPAARAGIRHGESIVGYNLTPLTKERASWKNETLDELNAHTPEALIGVQVRQKDKLVGIWKTRALMITKLRLRKRRELNGKDPLGEWTVDENVVKWDQTHVEQLRAPNEGVSESGNTESSSSGMENTGSSSVDNDDMSGSEDFGGDVDYDVDMSYDECNESIFPQSQSKVRPPPIVISPVTITSDAETDFVSPGITLAFRQAGGPLAKASLDFGWRDDLEGSTSLKVSTLYALCLRWTDAIPYERLRVLSPRFMVTVIDRNRLNQWPNKHSVLCMPVCFAEHWILLVMLNFATATTIFCMDSLRDSSVGEDTAFQVQNFLSVMNRNSSIQKISVVPQDNVSECGVHVVNYLARVIKLLDQAPDDKLEEALAGTLFEVTFTRASLAACLVDSFLECGRYWVYWAQFTSEDGKCWWPCRIISRSLASSICSRPYKKGFILVVWFNKVVNDVIWIKDIQQPLSKWTPQGVIAMCPSMSSTAKELLNDAYAQAREFDE